MATPRPRATFAFPASAGRGLRSLRALGVVVLLAALAFPAGPARAGGGDWPAYLGGLARTNFNSAETTLTPATVARLRLAWTAHAGGAVTTQPILANNLVYWGAWDGTERAVTLAGQPVWTASLGTTSGGCYQTAGVASTGAVATVAIGGAARSALYVGGGDGALYALDALTGAVLWRTSFRTSAGSDADAFVWSSPAVFNGHVYIGIAAFMDECGEPPGQLVQLDAATGAIQHTFTAVPVGCLGAPIWSSAAVDAATNSVYVATGQPDACPTAEPYAEALVRLNADDLTLQDSWQVPAAQQTEDGDFGATPTLFTAKLQGQQAPMVGLVNKNGVYYAFRRGALAAGPVWSTRISVGGCCPEGGNGSIASSAFDGGTLYVAGGATTIGGVSCAGGLRALDPKAGRILWEVCLPGAALAAPMATPGLVAIAAGTQLAVVDTSGPHPRTAFAFTAPSAATFWGTATIAGGVLYQGDNQGNLYAFSPR